MNDLKDYFDQNQKRVIHKWDHYFEIYDKHFSKYRGKEIVLLEIGTYFGGSLQMWKHYFGDKAKIYGMDINPTCKEVEEENITIMIGSQSDRNFLKRVLNEIPPIDILIDDGGHTMLQQIVTFEELFGHVKSDGIYLCEDIHTSYWKRFGGGYKRRGSFIEYSKNLIDELNAYHSIQKSFRATSFTSSVNSMHYYDSVLVIEKRPREKSFASQTGTIRIPFHKEQNLKGFELIKVKLKYKFKWKMNSLLAFFRLPWRNGDLFS
jgi:hypothetical protein